jgi:NAD(P)-dependent dehydrogenase (short-subunit alcohol dehydrogenase family)
MSRLSGKVALVTGAARGQGRSHAIELARAGADVIAVDICDQLQGVPYEMGNAKELAETASEVEALDRRIVTRKADVRDYQQMEAVVVDGLAELGRIDIVVANAGICTFAPVWEIDLEQWSQMIDVNLTGVFHTVRAVLPHMIAQGRVAR